MMNPDLDDPLPEALVAMNATLQWLAVRAPKFATQRPMSALFSCAGGGGGDGAGAGGV